MIGKNDLPQTNSALMLDSVAGLVPREEFESDEWDKESRVGVASKINSKAEPKS